jgi:hypothetical protein
MTPSHVAPGQPPGASSFRGYAGPDATIVTLGDADAWRAAAVAARPVLVIDDHCSPTDAERAAQGVLAGRDLVVAGAPVADTVKAIEGGFIVATVDRETLTTLRAPIAVSPRLAALVDAPVAGALVAWVERCRSLGIVEVIAVDG